MILLLRATSRANSCVGLVYRTRSHDDESTMLLKDLSHEYYGEVQARGAHRLICNKRHAPAVTAVKSGV